MLMHNRAFSQLYENQNAVEHTSGHDGIVLPMKRPKTSKFRNSITYLGPQNSITYLGPQLWSNLSADVRNLRDTHDFKKSVVELLNREFHGVTQTELLGTGLLLA